MTHTCLLAALPLLIFVGACPSLPAPLVSCEDDDACDATTGSPITSDGDPPTTSDGQQAATGASTDESSGDTTPDADTGDTTGEPTDLPMIIDGVIIPDYIDDNGVLAVEVHTEQSAGVRMLLDSGALIELTPAGPDTFAGQIPAFTALDNGQHPAVLTPWRERLIGEPVTVDYVIALPPAGSESGREIEGPGGRVAAIALLPDGRPVEFGTYEDMGAPRCYLHLRDKHGGSVEFVDLLPSVHCTALDLKIDRDSGKLQLLANRKQGDDTLWWAAELAAWGKGPKDIGTGTPGDTAFALAARPDLVAVCGARAVPTIDELDALAVLLRPGQPPEPRLFDYKRPSDKKPHLFTDIARDCAFAGDTLVLVGETRGEQDKDDLSKYNRHIVIESDVTTTAKPVWIVAGPELGLHTRALALDLDDHGRYHLVGDRCSDVCDPDGELWTYEPGGKLVDHTSIGPLGSSMVGPHDIAWSPAGYAVIAFAKMQGNSSLFKVQAFAPGDPVVLWTYPKNPEQGLEVARAVAVGPYGEVYAGGVAADQQPAFKRVPG